MHGMIEGKKWCPSKETGLVAKEILVEEVIKDELNQADSMVRECLQRILEDFDDIFLDKVPHRNH